MKRAVLLSLACVAVIAITPEKASEPEPLAVAESGFLNHEQILGQLRVEDHEHAHPHGKYERREPVAGQELFHPEHRDDRDHGHRAHGHRRHEEQEHHPRNQPGHEHRHEHKHSNYKEIIEQTFFPDYFEPTVVVDYRYLKSGGRDYVRGPGGQILILPKGMKNLEPKEFPDYDSLIEHLRRKNQGKAYRVEDVSRMNQRDEHLPMFNQRDDAPHARHHWH